MSVQPRRITVPETSLFLLCVYWAAALLLSPDSWIVLDRVVRLPLFGPRVASGVFFVAAPLVGWAVFLAVRSKARTRGPVLVLFPAVMVLNAFRCLKLHDPVLSHLAAGLAVAGACWAFREWTRAPAFSGHRTLAARMFAAAGLAAALATGAVLVGLLIPWSLRGDLPGRLNTYPFGPALRSALYADLAGYEQPAGGAKRSFRGLRLEGADLSRAVLKRADLRNARLFRARLYWTDLEAADLRGARLSGAGLSFVDLRDADLRGANLGGVYARGADLRNAVLSGSFLFHLMLYDSDARGARFDSSQMKKAHFFGSDLRGASFRESRLPGSSFAETRLDGADLSKTVLTGAIFLRTVFRGAALREADLGGAYYLDSGALAEASTLRGARLDPALLKRMKRLAPGLF